MEYSKLVAVTGMPGLFELINTKGDGALVRSLDDRSTKFVSNRSHHFSQLENIEVYTTGENVNLAEVLLAMQSSGESLPDEKDPDALRKYFEKVYPNLDFERVYTSDLKKMARWFRVLQQHNIAIGPPAEAPENASSSEESADEPAAPGAEPRPAKRASRKKS
ncbi:MAG TPA: DUF5606 domain-containing protein [Chitinophagaceae bacterium]|nr:DUF5606 domain-containing protein [Chitinophagaceae bacterium]